MESPLGIYWFVALYKLDVEHGAARQEDKRLQRRVMYVVKDMDGATVEDDMRQMIAEVAPKEEDVLHAPTTIIPSFCRTRKSIF